MRAISPGLRHTPVFVLLGPPTGLAVLAGLALLVGSRPPNLGFSGWDLAKLVGVAYVLGVLPALLSASLVNRVRERGLKPEFAYVVLSGVLAGLGFGLAMTLPMMGLYGVSLSLASEPISLFVFLCCLTTSLAATLVCWAVTRLFDRLGPSRP